MAIEARRFNPSTYCNRAITLIKLGRSEDALYDLGAAKKLMEQAAIRSLLSSRVIDSVNGKMA